MENRPSTVEDMGIDREFWAGRRVLVTGHTGFKGAWLCLWLSSLESKVYGYALDPPTSPSLFELAGVKYTVASDFRGDVRDYGRLLDHFKRIQPELVIHLGAQSLVRASYELPLETFSVNVMGTAHVLEAARHVQSVKAVLIVTTDKCYKNKEWIHPYRETDCLGGKDPYSSSKACAELLTTAYRSSYCKDEGGLCTGLAIASARAGNVIGGGDWADDRLIPDCIRAFSTGQRLILRYPNAIRPWQHVLEPLGGYLMLCEKLSGPSAQCFAEGWNFGPNPADVDTVGELAQSVADLWGGGELTVESCSSTLHEALTLRLDTAKANLLLGWRPVWSLIRALRETVDWYKAWHRGEDMREYTFGQIARFEQEVFQCPQV